MTTKGYYADDQLTVRLDSLAAVRKSENFQALTLYLSNGAEVEMAYPSEAARDEAYTALRSALTQE